VKKLCKESDEASGITCFTWKVLAQPISKCIHDLSMLCSKQVTC